MINPFIPNTAEATAFDAIVACLAHANAVEGLGRSYVRWYVHTKGQNGPADLSSEQEQTFREAWAATRPRRVKVRADTHVGAASRWVLK